MVIKTYKIYLQVNWKGVKVNHKERKVSGTLTVKVIIVTPNEIAK